VRKKKDDDEASDHSWDSDNEVPGETFICDQAVSPDKEEKPRTVREVFMKNFLGHSDWRFKLFIVCSLLLNPLITWLAGPTVGAWMVLLEFLVTLAAALEAYPLQAGGILVIEANFIGLTNPHTLLHEVITNLNVILMIIFMVAAIHFMKNLLLWIFTKILIKVEDKTMLSVLMLLCATVMSAFLDALTVSAVVVSVCTGFLGVYYHVVKHSKLPRLQKRRRGMKFQLHPKGGNGVGEAPKKEIAKDGNHTNGRVEDHKAVENHIEEQHPQKEPEKDSVVTPDEIEVHIPKLAEVLERKVSDPKLDKGQANGETFETKDAAEMEEIERTISRFKAFLRSLLMHCAVGTTFGGIMTMVGEPQNLIVADRMEWDFGSFIIKLMPVWASVLPCAIVTCIALEKSKRCGYGCLMPDDVRSILQDFEQSEYGKLDSEAKTLLAVQAFGATLLCLGLVLHMAEVGFVGLGVVIFLTTLNGVTEEHQIAHAFLESMPFVSLLVVFFGIVGMIHDQELFKPIIDWVLTLDESLQASVLFMVNGVLSMVSDNVFVATIFVDEIAFAFRNGHGGDSGGSIHADQHAAGGSHGSHEPHAHRVLQAKQMSREHYETLGIAIIAGTNLPSMATPNGQAALLFILTSNIAPLVQLSYRKMCIMTLPYTIMATTIGLLALILLVPLTI
jgi:Na+/H+ antiporter NhaB